MWSKKTLFSILVLILAVYLYTKFTAKPKEGTTVKTKSGQVKGVLFESTRESTEYYAWLGIPYAEPPVGPLRFATPKPVTAWTGVLDGSSTRSGCAQIFFFVNWIVGNEDCLFLHVYTPKKSFDDKKKLPVIAYIHGGAFVGGSGADFNPDFFMDKGVLIVSMNYRLGVLGFLSLGDKNIRGNMGLKDQALALKWIKENIESFGGDPSQITIWGGSAGAASVHYQTLSEQTRGLFHRAFSQSGVSILPWAFWPSEKAIAKSKSLASDLNCPINEGNEKITQCLRNLDVTTLLSAYIPDSTGMSITGPAKFGEILSPTVELVVDEEAFLTQSPYDIIAQGKAHRIPLLSGIARDEGLIASASLFNNQSARDYVEKNWDKSIQNVFRLSNQKGGAEAADKLLQFYFGKNSMAELSLDDKLARYTDMLGDGLFLVGNSEVAAAQRDFSPVYLYYYNKTGGLSMTFFSAELKMRYNPIIEIGIVIGKYLVQRFIWREPVKDYGIFHAEDLLMIMPLPGFGLEKGDPLYTFSDDLVSLYASFVKDDLKSLQFRGVKFEPTPKNGPLKYLMISDEPAMIPEPFAHRSELWRFINYAQLFSSPKK